MNGPSFLNVAREVVTGYRELLSVDDNTDAITVAAEAYGGLTICERRRPDAKPICIQIDDRETARQMIRALAEWIGPDDTKALFASVYRNNVLALRD